MSTRSIRTAPSLTARVLSSTAALLSDLNYASRRIVELQGPTRR